MFHKWIYSNPNRTCLCFSSNIGWGCRWAVWWFIVIIIITITIAGFYFVVYFSEDNHSSSIAYNEIDGINNTIHFTYPISNVGVCEKWDFSVSAEDSFIELEKLKNLIKILAVRFNISFLLILLLNKQSTHCIVIPPFLLLFLLILKSNPRVSGGLHCLGCGKLKKVKQHFGTYCKISLTSSRQRCLAAGAWQGRHLLQCWRSCRCTCCSS